ncbi:dephospho-CoA kinase, partial [Enterococcus faecalis]|uniref:dephospho-CoA kinase n=1 Tax=Enterococcus faecalis TaxID=1351 RepID=UPI003CC636A5
ESLKPFLRIEILRQIEEAKKKDALVIVDIPLLYEAHYEAIMDQVAVVFVPEKIQKVRLMPRNQLTEEEAHQRIPSQW